MFTGLIKDIGTITQINDNVEGREFTIESPQLIDDIFIDDSVAVNGTCLTAFFLSPISFKVQAVHVTLSKTTLGQLKVGSKVNLELALKASDRLGGHFVQGHINGVGNLLSLEKKGDNHLYQFSIPKGLKAYLIKEGSIALDGISLTISDLTDTTFFVSLIPHTIARTTLHYRQPGDQVNIEVDVLAKYIENFLNINKINNNHKNQSLLTADWLQEKGL